MKNFLIVSCIFLSTLAVPTSNYAQSLGSDVIYKAAYSSDSSIVKQKLISNFKADPLSETAIDELSHYGVTYMTFEKDSKKDLALYNELVPYIDEAIDKNPLVLRYRLNKIDLANFSLNINESIAALIKILNESERINYSWNVDSGFEVYEDAEAVLNDLETRFLSVTENAKQEKNVSSIDNLMSILNKQTGATYMGNIILAQMSNLLAKEEDFLKYIDKSLSIDKMNTRAYILILDYASKNKNKSLTDKYYQLAQKNITNKDDLDNIKSHKR